jgi:hypothetical protein
MDCWSISVNVSCYVATVSVGMEQIALGVPAGTEQQRSRTAGAPLQLISVCSGGSVMNYALWCGPLHRAG